jgi:hypothetical protein
MNYSEFVSEQLAKSEGLKKAVELIRNAKGKKCLVFFHDDPDGLTSGAIIVKTLEKSGAIVTYDIPDTMELEKFRIENELKKKNYDALFIKDKATMGYYDEYPSLVKDVVIIDHHPLIGKLPEKCVIVNPSVPSYTFCSAAILCNMIAELTGTRDDKTDFLTLIGLKGDWAIEPATDFVAPFCRPFYDEAVEKFPNMLKKIAGRPTMFEVNQRAVTTVLNQAGEFFFALSGGGFQYFYNHRVSEIKDKNQAEFAYIVLSEMEAKDYVSLKDMTDRIYFKAVAAKIYGCFLEDWERASKMFDNLALFDIIDGAKVHLFLGNNVPLMPMVGSVKLYELGQSCVLIMFNWLDMARGTHISFRANTDKVHCGNIAAGITEKLVAKFGNKGIISGGGHPRAAEFRTRSSGVSFFETLKAFCEVFAAQTSSKAV